ncbi:OmpA family protein [Sulfitobacter pseudonitzschiae]|uniref:OmpA family protein n=1 Tax=Pseudosulfitobacter pseudonitzschiae TaxID=1402135 RepID=A0A9Q2NN24_9RHOB|nr:MULTISPECIES: OmpA family protein [Roseobacteraceae]MBM2292471.1 OmpA family protein [Pseudosulfitobacter pseudonitzschiae]MBM2297388.1 OmpA family protein [Pseudosulfitobacter pseudonitzschiae]MBM2302302.1 OmpA family protein [Pseudosulfitobacter pseudonitzschiae]MBM2312085.1 OmpA family protein [Pseudosulfitobacter pseudonitzschiae]MBM2316998.1 OmpA family protein [Pseudosulfitobacter pseudonitzschiae]|tara:strand:- start:6859 stop:7527 length:669 start_codon:yes stop_codon:yes gene_type:complete
MNVSKISIAAILMGSMALTACTAPGQLGGNPNDPKRNTKTGALAGAVSGALLGAAVSDDGDRGDGALIGAVLGGAVGAGVGYNLDKQEAELRRSMDSNVQITNTGDRLIVTLPQDILFATDSFAVRSDLRDDLSAVAASLQRYPGSTVQVIGHTDSDGDAAYNQQLSERRATAVSEVLLQNGVPYSRIQSFGRGESQPVATNLNAAGKAQNRRVEIVILPNA